MSQTLDEMKTALAAFEAARDKLLMGDQVVRISHEGTTTEFRADPGLMERLERRIAGLKRAIAAAEGTCPAPKQVFVRG